MSKGIFEKRPGSGIWWIRYADARGRIVRESIGPKTLAVKMYGVRKAEVAQGRHLPSKRRATLAVAAAKYLDGVKQARTIKDIERLAGLWIEHFGDRDLREIEAHEIQSVANMRLDHVSEQTVRHELTVLRSIYLWAQRARYCEATPLSDVRFPKPNNSRVRYLMDDEEQRLRESLPPASWPMVEFALHTGLRQSEQFGLKWSDVDLAVGVLTVARSKDGQARRVELNETATAILRGRVRALRCDWVWPNASQRGKFHAANFYRRVFVPAMAKAKIDNFRWHDLRHTFASRLAMQSVDLNIIRELLGHKTMAMTMRYAHLAPSARRKAVRQLNGNVGASTDTITDTRGLG